VTREDIIRWALEAEDYADTIYQKGEWHPGWVEVLNQRFAALVAEAEREACAKVCDEIGGRDSDSHAWDAAAAIRVRGSK
jgi:hypothetical protein